MAEDYPDDHRNNQSAVALTSLAQYVERMPSTHRAFTAISILDKTGILDGGPEFSSMAGRFGFANNWVEPDDAGMEHFIEELVEVYVDEWLTDYIDGGAEDWESIAQDVGIGEEWIERQRRLGKKIDDADKILAGRDQSR